jgi:hypothetical protein
MVPYLIPYNSGVLMYGMRLSSSYCLTCSQNSSRNDRGKSMIQSKNWKSRRTSLALNPWLCKTTHYSNITRDEYVQRFSAAGSILPE